MLAYLNDGHPCPKRIRALRGRDLGALGAVWRLAGTPALDRELGL